MALFCLSPTTSTISTPPLRLLSHQNHLPLTIHLHRSSPNPHRFPGRCLAASPGGPPPPQPDPPTGDDPTPSEETLPSPTVGLLPTLGLVSSSREMQLSIGESGVELGENGVLQQLCLGYKTPCRSSLLFFSGCPSSSGLQHGMEEIMVDQARVLDLEDN